MVTHFGIKCFLRQRALEYREIRDPGLFKGVFSPLVIFGSFVNRTLRSQTRRNS
jgi:hypothetical protein